MDINEKTIDWFMGRKISYEPDPDSVIMLLNLIQTPRTYSHMHSYIVDQVARALGTDDPELAKKALKLIQAFKQTPGIAATFKTKCNAYEDLLASKLPKSPPEEVKKTGKIRKSEKSTGEGPIPALPAHSESDMYRWNHLK